MNKVNIYFSEYFNISEDLLEEYGALNLSLILDLPLFMDPFLLFNSKKEKYQNIHNEIIKYFLFLHELSNRIENINDGTINAYFTFHEVKQNWLGFSKYGNNGKGLGKEFGKNLYKGLRTNFQDFNLKNINEDLHIEKLNLIDNFVGRDKISDLTTNFAKKYLLEYTSDFARKHINKDYCDFFNIEKVQFNYSTESWESQQFYLPKFNDSYIILTPKDLLKRENTFINREDMIKNLDRISYIVDDQELRALLDNYLQKKIKNNENGMTRKVNNEEKNSFIKDHPVLINYYIRYKEINSLMAKNENKKEVDEIKSIFIDMLPILVDNLSEKTDFYKIIGDSFDEAYQRIMYFKTVIENMDGYKIFYKNEKVIVKESDVQLIFRFACINTKSDVNREVNNGRGPVDYKFSNGSEDSTIIEFKLAKNKKIKQNLQNQLEIYAKANNVSCKSNTLTAILYFNDNELNRIDKILKELKKENSKEIILIDARYKESASNVRFILDLN